MGGGKQDRKAGKDDGKPRKDDAEPRSRTPPRGGARSPSQSNVDKLDSVATQLSEAAKSFSESIAVMSTISSRITALSSTTPSHTQPANGSPGNNGASSSKAGATHGPGKKTKGPDQKKKRKVEGGDGRGTDDEEADLPSGKDNLYRHLCVTIAKLALSDAKSLRNVKAVVLEVLLVPRSCQAIDLCKSATKALAERMQEVDKSERSALDMPHCYVWRNLVKWAKEEAGKQSVPQAARGFFFYNYFGNT